MVLDPNRSAVIYRAASQTPPRRSRRMEATKRAGSPIREMLSTMHLDRTFADYFAGIGLVRYGLERAGWQSRYALDYDEGKRAMYAANYPDAGAHYHLLDVREAHGASVPPVTLVHASFPCTDLSLAGAREGLDGPQSSAFWAFAERLREMPERPPLVTLENVTGLLTSRGGRDLAAVLEALAGLGYSVDVLVLDAAHFVPQSRVRLIVVATRRDVFAPSYAATERGFAQVGQHPARPPKLGAFMRAHASLPWSVRPLPPLPKLARTLGDIIDLGEEAWWPEERTGYLLSQMYARHSAWIDEARPLSRWSYGTVFRRMRMREGRKQSTAELRTDGLAGCLRTPKGGSARQILVRAGHGRVDARLLNARECARLMGAEDFVMASDLALNTALFGFGDAVCAPVFTWVAQHVLEPLLAEAGATAVFEPSTP
jgi:DNA (cytosine-5)-methyltransferase 1